MLHKLLSFRALIVLVLLIVFVAPVLPVHAQGPVQPVAQPAPSIDLNTLYNLGILVIFIIYVIVREVQQYQRDKQHFNLLTSLTDNLKAGDDNPMTMTAIAGARDNIPPQFVTDLIALLTTAKVIAPQTGPLADQLQRLLIPPNTKTEQTSGLTFSPFNNVPVPPATPDAAKPPDVTVNVS